MIQTKVARVVSPTELVLAAGSSDGISEGMEFVIFTVGDPVFDPETKEELGRIEIVKARVIAAHVQERLTVARTRSKTVTVHNPYFSGSSFAAAMRALSERTETEWEQMKVDKVEGLPADRVVRVGDMARTLAKPVPISQPELVAQ